MNRSRVFVAAEDGYPDGIPAAMTAILNQASTYGFTSLGHNPEWSAPITDKVARQKAIHDELILQGNTRPLVFVPVYGDFVSSHSLFAPYCDGFGVQLQNQDVGTEGGLAASAMTLALADFAPRIPLMYFQLACRPIDNNGLNPRTVTDVVNAVEAVSAVPGVSGVHLWFTGAGGNYWSFAQDVINILRP